MTYNESTLYAISTRKAMNDFEFFAKHCVKIRAKNGRVKPLELNSVQKKILAEIADMEAKGLPVRLIILKARQMGVSTLIEIYILWKLLQRPNLHALEMAHEKQQSAPHIFDITRFAVNNLPEWFTSQTGLKTNYQTKDGLTFNQGAALSVSSADSKEPGRSLTIGMLHLSECAFYDSPEALLPPLFAAMPKTNDTYVFVESTGNGPAGWYYDTFQRAKNGKNGYRALFYPWYEHEEYRMPVPKGYEVRVPPEYERLYFEGKVDDEQLYWREWVIENDFNGDETAFLTEYPATENDAWMQNAAGVFGREAVQAQIKRVEADVTFKEGFLQVFINSQIDPTQSVTQFLEASEGSLRIFKMPIPGKYYVIGADVGSGVAQKDGDPSSADVLDAITGEQVAHLHELVEPEQFALDLYALGLFYNMALIAPEVTGGHGLTVVNWLRDRGYYMLYKRKYFDKTTSEWTETLGWSTTKRTKEFIIDGLRAAFLNGEVTINEKNTLIEMQTFVERVNKNGTRKLEAISGAKDDRVISIAIANMTRKEVFAAYIQQNTVEQEKQQQQQQVAKAEELDVRSIGWLMEQARMRNSNINPSY